MGGSTRGLKQGTDHQPTAACGTYTRCRAFSSLGCYAAPPVSCGKKFCPDPPSHAVPPLAKGCRGQTLTTTEYSRALLKHRSGVPALWNATCCGGVKVTHGRTDVMKARAQAAITLRFHMGPSRRGLNQWTDHQPTAACGTYTRCRAVSSLGCNAATPIATWQTRSAPTHPPKQYHRLQKGAEAKHT